MPTLRLCSHIKTNGQKCGSPALRHHTLCYFHYQWQRRDQRRVRLGGPIGMGKNTGIELPLLDGPEAILVSIMEIQHALIDNRIEIKMGTALLYSLQLALQAKISYFGLCAREPVRECPELDLELEMERAKAMRPAKEKCDRCPKHETCTSARDCRKLPKVPGYHRVGNRLVRDTTTDSSSRAKVANGLSRAAVSALATVVEGPAFPPTEAAAFETSSVPDIGTNLLRELSPADRGPCELVRGVRANCEESVPPKFPPSGAPHLPQLADVGSAHARHQTVPSQEKQKVLRLRDSRRSAQDDTPKATLSLTPTVF